jgi:hypothetical protein
MEVPEEIIRQAYDTKKGVYEDIYDINNEKYYEGDLKETEAKYLAALAQIRAISNKTLQAPTAEAPTATAAVIATDIPNVSPKTRESLSKLLITIQSVRSDDPIDNLPIQSFIDNYFFKYPWWLGNSEDRIE